MDAVINSIKTKFVVFGLDGCISNDEWRRPFVHPAQTGIAARTDYYVRSAEDKPFELGETLVKYHVNDNNFIVFCTARPFMYNEATSQWIQQTFKIEPQKDYVVLMRGNEDDRPEIDVKREQLQHLMNWTEQSGRQIILAYDDNTTVTEYYASRGIPAVHLSGNAYMALKSDVPPPGPVIQYPTEGELTNPPEPCNCDLGGAALHQNMAISPTDFIVANGLTFLEGSVVQLISEWHTMRNVDALRQATELIRKIISMEERQ